MSKPELLTSLDGFSEHLLLALAQSDQLKQQVKVLIEENARLRLENRQLQELLSQLQSPQPEKSSQPEHGRGHLEEIYMAGFHVCNDKYGQAHETNDGCLDCLELLYRD